MPLPTKNLIEHLKRESATINLIGLLTKFKINCEYDGHIDGPIPLLSLNQVARFVRRMSKINL